jgi:hypothetical protein
LTGDALDRCRRRVQQDLHGHRGRKADPLYSARRTLHTSVDLLTDRQKSRTVTFRVRVYTAIELARLLEDVGFAGVECFGDLDERKLWRESRLVVGARKPVR